MERRRRRRRNDPQRDAFPRAALVKLKGFKGARDRAALAYSQPSIMPVRRGHVAPQNTFLGIIIRKFEGQSECHLPDVAVMFVYLIATIKAACGDSVAVLLE